MKIIHLTCGHKIKVHSWPSSAGMAKVRHHYKKFHPARMKAMTKKSLATKRRRGLINPKKKFGKQRTWICLTCHSQYTGRGFPQRLDRCIYCGSNQLRAKGRTIKNSTKRKAWKCEDCGYATVYHKSGYPCPQCGSKRIYTFEQWRSKPISKRHLGNPAKKPVVIYDRLLEMSAYRDGNFPKRHRGTFKHDFSRDPDAKVIGMPDGSLKIVPSKGKRLWKKINY